MRKVIYGCTALVAVGAAGAFLLIDYASRYPESGAARWITTVVEVGAEANPFTVVLGQQVTTGPLGCEVQPAQVQPPCLALGNKPPKPLPGTAVEEPMEVIRVEPAAEEGVAQAADSAEEAAPEACEPLDRPADAVAEETTEPDRVGTAEESEVGEDAEWANVRMPYADEDEAPEATTDAACDWLWKILDEMSQSDAANAQDEPCEAEEAPVTKDATGTTDAEQGPNSATPDSQPEQSPSTNSDYHHEQGCPYMGCPYPHSSYCPPPAYMPPADEAPAQAQQLSLPVKKIKKFLKKKPAANQSGNSAPAQGATGDVSCPSNVDTMEYRPTDGDADAYRDLRF